MDGAVETLRINGHASWRRGGMGNASGSLSAMQLHVEWMRDQLETVLRAILA